MIIFTVLDHNSHVGDVSIGDLQFPSKGFVEPEGPPSAHCQDTEMMIKGSRLEALLD